MLNLKTCVPGRTGICAKEGLWTYEFNKACGMDIWSPSSYLLVPMHRTISHKMTENSLVYCVKVGIAVNHSRQISTL